MGRFYKTTMPTYENFIDEIPYELLGLAIAKKEGDLSNTEQGLQSAGQILSNLKTRARKPDAQYLQEKVSEVEKIIDETTQNLVKNPDSYREAQRRLKQVSAQLQQEMNNGKIGEIVREFDDWQKYLKEAQERRDFLIKQKVGDAALIASEYERVLAMEDEDYQGFEKSARKGNFSKWGLHGTDFTTSMGKVLKKFQPTENDWKVLENWGTAKIDRSGKTISVDDNRIMKAIFDYTRTPQGSQILARDIHLGRYSAEDFTNMFTEEGKLNPERSGAFDAVVKTLVEQYKQSKSKTSTDRSGWSESGKKLLTEGAKKLQVQISKNYFLGGEQLTAINVDSSGGVYYGVQIGDNLYAVSPDVLEKAKIFGFKAVKKKPGKDIFNDDGSLNEQATILETEYYQQSEIEAAKSFLELTQRNQELHSQKKHGDFYFEDKSSYGVYPILTQERLLEIIAEEGGSIKAASTFFAYGGIVQKFDLGGEVKHRRAQKLQQQPPSALGHRTRHNQTYGQTQTYQQQPQSALDSLQEKTFEPKFLGVPTKQVAYATANKTFKDYLSDVQISKQKLESLHRHREATITDKVMLKTEYANSMEALSSQLRKAAEIMKIDKVFDGDENKIKDVVDYGYNKITDNLDNYYFEDFDNRTIDIEKLILPAVKNNKNSVLATKNLIEKTFFSQDENGDIKSNLEGVFVDEDGKVKVTPDAFVKFYENIDAQILYNQSKLDSGTLSLTNYGKLYDQTPNLVKIQKPLKNTYASIKNEIDTKDRIFNTYIHKIDKIQKTEEIENIAISFDPKVIQENKEDMREYGLELAPVENLKKDIQEVMKNILERYPELIEEFKIYPRKETDSGITSDAGNALDEKFLDDNFTEILFTQRGRDLLKKFSNADFTEILFTPRGVDLVFEDFILNLPNIYKQSKSSYVGTSKVTNMQNEVAKPIRDYHLDIIKQSGVEDIFNPILTIGDKKLDLTNDSIVGDRGKLRVLREQIDRAVILSNLYLATNISKGYFNLPSTQTDTAYMESKTGFATNLERLPKSNFIVFDPQTKINFKVSKTDDGTFTIFAKSIHNNNYTEVVKGVQDTPQDIQREIIGITQAAIENKK